MFANNDNNTVFDDVIDILVAIITKELKDKEEADDGT